MKFVSTVLTVLVVCFASVQAGAKELALVLSFQNYENGADVRNGLSRHDAVLAAYRAAGFQTFDGRDRSQEQLRRLLRDFVEELPKADKVVIHITGQVVSFGGQSWILPSDSAANSLADLEIDGISVDFLLELLATKPGNSVLFLGSSERNFGNISGTSRGVSIENIPQGVIMVSGLHRAVSEAVLNDFLRSGITVVEALANNRRNISIRGDIPFGLILAEGNAAPRVDTPEDIENALRLSRSQRREVQTNLTLLGYGLGSIDGIFGNATRRALRNWQQHERHSVTGYLTRDQFRQLDRLTDDIRQDSQAEDRNFWTRTGAAGSAVGLRSYLSRYPNGLFAERARNELASVEGEDDQRAWDHAQEEDSLNSYQEYLRRYPTGLYNRPANARVQEILSARPDPSEGARRAEDRLRLDQASKLLVELRLSGLGYRIGSADGNIDNATRRGIRGYQGDRGLPVTGYLSADMIRLLLLGR